MKSLLKIKLKKVGCVNPKHKVTKPHFAGKGCLTLKLPNFFLLSKA